MSAYKRSSTSLYLFTLWSQLCCSSAQQVSHSMMLFFIVSLNCHSECCSHSATPNWIMKYRIYQFIIFSQKHRIKSKKVKPANQRDQEITSIKYLLAFIFDHKLGKYCVKRRLFYWPAVSLTISLNEKPTIFVLKLSLNFFLSSD